MNYSREALDFFGMGLKVMNFGELEDAANFFQRAVEVEPDFCEAYYNLGCVRLNLGQAEEAVGFFEKAISIKPDFAEFHFMLGTAWGVLGDAQKSYQATVRGIKIMPDNPKAQYNAGRAAFFLQAFWDASLRFMAALTLNSADQSAALNLGSSLARYMNLDDWELHDQGSPVDLQDKYNFAKLALSFWAFNLGDELTNSLEGLEKSDPVLADEVKIVIKKMEARGIRDSLERDVNLALADSEFFGVDTKFLS